MLKTTDLKGFFIMEIRDLITFHGATTFHHMRRQANEEAHQLARHALKFSIWFEWSQCNCLCGLQIL